MKSPLDGVRGWWLRQYSDTSEQTTSKILDTLTTLGGGKCLCLKVCDGITFQGDIDSLTPVKSVADIANLKQVCNERGIGFIPVIVPRLHNVVAEEVLHASIATACGSALFDAEPYQGFIDQNLNQFPTYCKQVRKLAPNAYLMLQHDPRSYGSSGIQLPLIQQYFNAFCAQHYVGWTEIGWTNVQQEIASFQQLASYGKDMYATVYAEGDTTLVTQFWNGIKANALGLCAFALGAANTDQLQAIAALDVGAPVDDTLAKIRSLAQQIIDITGG